MEKSLSIIQSRLNKAQFKYRVSIVEAEKRLTDKIQFSFSIGYQYSDGWTIIESDSGHLAPLESCLKIINTKGVLSLEDFYIECI